jgi:hypothetical protein
VSRLAWLGALAGGLASALEGNHPSPSPSPCEPALFAIASRPPTMVPSRSPTIIRARYVTVRPALAGTKEAPAKTIKLNLFDDVCLTARLIRVETPSAETFVWLGRIEALRSSEVALAVGRSLLQGNISVPGGSYQIRHVRDGIHAVYQVDPATFPRDEPPRY